MTIRGILAVGVFAALGIGAGISAHAAEVTYGVPGFDLAQLNGSPRTGNLDISLTANAAGHGKPCDSCAAGRSLDAASVAIAGGGTTVIPPSTWLGFDPGASADYIAH
jgi:hypothetical protein